MELRIVTEIIHSSGVSGEPPITEKYPQNLFRVQSLVNDGSYNIYYMVPLMGGLLQGNGTMGVRVEAGCCIDAFLSCALTTGELITMRYAHA